MNFRTRSLAVSSFALFLAGCGMFSAPRSPAPELDPSKAPVLVLYHVHFGPEDEGFTDHNVYLDGTRVGHLNPGEELRLHVPTGLGELRIRPETAWLGSARKDALKYGLEMPPGSTRYLRYRTTTGEGRVAPVTGTVFADRELSLVTEREYDARN